MPPDVKGVYLGDTHIGGMVPSGLANRSLAELVNGIFPLRSRREHEVAPPPPFNPDVMNALDERNAKARKAAWEAGTYPGWKLVFGFETAGSSLHTEVSTNGSASADMSFYRQLLDKLIPDMDSETALKPLKWDLLATTPFIEKALIQSPGRPDLVAYLYKCEGTRVKAIVDPPNPKNNGDYVCLDAIGLLVLVPENTSLRVIQLVRDKTEAKAFETGKALADIPGLHPQYPSTGLEGDFGFDGDSLESTALFPGVILKNPPIRIPGDAGETVWSPSSTSKIAFFDAPGITNRLEQNDIGDPTKGISKYMQIESMDVELWTVFYNVDSLDADRDQFIGAIHWGAKVSNTFDGGAPHIGTAKVEPGSKLEKKYWENTTDKEVLTELKTLPWGREIPCRNAKGSLKLPTSWKNPFT